MIVARDWKLCLPRLQSDLWNSRQTVTLEAFQTVQCRLVVLSPFSANSTYSHHIACCFSRRKSTLECADNRDVSCLHVKINRAFLLQDFHLGGHGQSHSFKMPSSK